MNPAKKEDIAGWLGRGIEQGSTYMLVVCDCFDHEDYPVYVRADQDVRAVVEEYGKRPGEVPQRIMEVYDLKGNLEQQLDEKRPWHLGTGEEIG